MLELTLQGVSPEVAATDVEPVHAIPSKRTFTGTAGLQFKLVVPAQFLLDMRSDAQVTEDVYEDVLGPNPDSVAFPKFIMQRVCVRRAASPFLQAAQAQHPANDDAFIGMVLSNGIRNNMRNRLKQLLYDARIGGTISPAAIELIPTVPDFLNDITIQTIEVPNKENTNAG